VFKYKTIDNHKILSKPEWEAYLRAMPEVALTQMFLNRVLLVPCRDSDISELTAHLIVKNAVQQIKEALVGTKLQDVCYVCVPELDDGKIYNESDLFKSVSIPVYFRQEGDKEYFLKQLGSELVIKGTS
jgi:hypothetical protein